MKFKEISGWIQAVLVLILLMELSWMTLVWILLCLKEELD